MEIGCQTQCWRRRRSSWSQTGPHGRAPHSWEAPKRDCFYKDKDKDKDKNEDKDKDKVHLHVVVPVRSGLLVHWNQIGWRF